MSFESIAPIYRALETLVFGNALQAARVAMIPQVDSPQRVLIAGEGDGRFLAEFVCAFPDCDVTCVDGSARMLELARRRIAGKHARVDFVQADLLQRLPVTGDYDLIVTHFFLDCFDGAQLPLVVKQFAERATPNAQWLVADFAIPDRGVRRCAARSLIAVMYWFFRLTTEIGAKQLVDPRPAMSANGFRQVREQLLLGGIVTSQLWQRGAIREGEDPAEPRGAIPAQQELRPPLAIPRGGSWFRSVTDVVIVEGNAVVARRRPQR